MQFSDLRISSSTRMQLAITGSDYKTQTLAGQFLGYRPGVTLLVYLLKKPSLALHKESKVSARIGLQSAIIQFDSAIESISESPYYYLHLRYPTSVVIEQQLRQCPRFDVEAPITATIEGSTPIQVQGRLLDISLNGARLEFREELPAEQITLSATIFIVGTQQLLNLNAAIKRVITPADSPAEFVYGARFIDVSAAQKLMLQALCYELQAAMPL